MLSGLTSDLYPLTSEKRSRHSAFTLLELLVVMGIIALLLVAVVPAVTSLSKSSGRKGAISNLLGAIEQGRAEAIKAGQPTYVVFPIFPGMSPATDRYNYKSYAIFVDDPANPAAPKQLTNWKIFPTGVSMRSQISSWPTAPFTFTPLGSAPQAFPYLKFNANGEVESPDPTPATSVTLTVFEGYMNGATEVKTSRVIVTESISIARLTGRAERTP